MKQSEVLQHPPRSLQLWAQIEEKAQQRAEERFQEILKKARACAGIASNQIAPQNGERSSAWRGL